MSHILQGPGCDAPGVCPATRRAVNAAGRPRSCPSLRLGLAHIELPHAAAVLAPLGLGLGRTPREARDGDQQGDDGDHLMLHSRPPCRYTHHAMCGRYTETAAFEELAERFGITLDQDEAEDLRPSYNVAPSQMVPVVVNADGGRALRLARWGFKPYWIRASKLAPINARAETLLRGWMFREAVKRARCLIPADGFIGANFDARIQYGLKPQRASRSA